MTTINSIPFSTNMPKVDPSLAEVNNPENTTEKALARWTPKQRESFFTSKEELNHPLTDYLADPTKAMFNNAFYSTVLPLGAYEATSRLFPNVKVPFTGNTTLKGLKPYFWFAILTTTGLFTAIPEYFNQKSVNKDTLQGIKTLGTHASKKDWNDYKKTHPETAKE